MKLLLQLLARSDFLRHNAILFVGSLAAGALNYLYYPVLGRLLEPAAFGEVQALVSLFLQLSIFLTVLGLITVNIVANYEDQVHRNQVIFEFEKLALLLSIAALVAVTIISPWLKQLLNFEATWPFVILMLSIVATVPLTFRGAFLRGKKKFGLSAAATLVSAGGKLIGSAALVMAGLGTSGAIAGLAVAQLVSSGFSGFYADKWGLKKTDSPRKFTLPNMWLLLPELKYGLLVLVGSLVITLQYSIDILIVKHYFDAATAGLYAGISSVARIIFFLTASISLVLLPSVKVKAPLGHNKQLLLKSLFLLAAVGLPTLLLFSLFPDWIVTLLMGSNYGAYTHLLPRLSQTVFIIAVLNLFVLYFVALRRYGVAVIAIIGAVVTYGLMLWSHASLEAVVNDLLIGSIVMLCLLGLWAGGTVLGGKQHRGKAHFNRHAHS